MGGVARHHVVNLEPWLFRGQDDAVSIHGESGLMNVKLFKGHGLDLGILNTIDLVKAQSLIETGRHEDLEMRKCGIHWVNFNQIYKETRPKTPSHTFKQRTLPEPSDEIEYF